MPIVNDSKTSNRKITKLWKKRIFSIVSYDEENFSQFLCGTFLGKEFEVNYFHTFPV